MAMSLRTNEKNFKQVAVVCFTSTAQVLIVDVDNFATCQRADTDGEHGSNALRHAAYRIHVRPTFKSQRFGDGLRWLNDL